MCKNTTPWRPSSGESPQEGKQTSTAAAFRSLLLTKAIHPSSNPQHSIPFFHTHPTAKCLLLYTCEISPHSTHLPTAMASSSSTRSRLHHPTRTHHHQQRQHSPLSSSSKTTTAATNTGAISSHLAMVELKHRILSSLSKLSDRDTHHLAVEELERIARSLPPEGLPMFLNSLLHDPPSLADPPSTARRECLRLLALLCSSHPEPAAAHLPKVVSHIARRLKESSSDSSVRDACRDAAGSLSRLYLGGGSSLNDPAGESYSSVVTLFVKPLLEAMGEQSKGVQAGAAACLAKVVLECAGGGGREGGGGDDDGERRRAAFQKLVPRVCKLLGGQSFLAKGALLSVVSSLAQIGAITPQSMQSVLQCIRDCLESGDWATRKAAADTLSVLASNSSHLVGDGAASTLTALEACRFDKVKPVRDSMSEALTQWKKLVVKDEDAASEDRKSTSNGDDNNNPASTDSGEKPDAKISNANDRMTNTRNSPSDSSPTADSTLESKNANIPEKAVVFLRKKAPSLTDKELNPEFFQKLETRSSDDLPVEVVLPRKCLQSLQDGDKKGPKNDGSKEISEPKGEAKNGSCGSTGAGYSISDKRMGLHSRMQDVGDIARDRWSEQRIFKGKDFKTKALDGGESSEISQRDVSFAHGGTLRTENHSEMNNKGNWFAIQRQLSQLERQQANLMNMLQDFMGGSHDSMITLENRVRGLERIVEDMARELSLSGRRSTSMLMGFDGSPGRPSSKFNGFLDYNSKFSRGPEGRVPYTERFLSSDGMTMRARDPTWRSDSEPWGSYGYGAPRNGSASSRRNFGGSSVDGRLPRTENDDDQVGNRRGWEKGQGPFRLGEGPSARSVWQASKDEATLEAIRVAGEDNGVHRTAPKKAIPELDAEVDDQNAQERGSLWASWSHAMDSLHVGDVDSAYAEILSTGDELLLVKLMDKSGPVIDRLSSEIANEILHVLGQLLQEQSLHDLVLTWIQQLSDLVAENGPEFLGINVETKRKVLLGLHEASSLEPPEDWEGATAEQLVRHLAGAWGVNLQQLVK